MLNLKWIVLLGITGIYSALFIPNVWVSSVLITVLLAAMLWLTSLFYRERIDEQERESEAREAAFIALAAAQRRSGQKSGAQSPY